MRVDIAITAGPAKGQRFTFDKPDRFLFGRSTEARVSLPADPYVSRRHFLLEISPPECKLTDLDSKNGTIVNGIRYGGKKPLRAEIMQAPDDVKEVYLKDGDEIIVGDTHLHISLSKLSDREYPGRESTISHTHPPVPLPTKALPVPNLRAETGKDAHHAGILKKMLKEAADAQKVVPNAPDIQGYRIEDLIDRGGMGIVYKARNLATGQIVAIKTMLPHMATEQENVTTFLREIEVMQQLTHPNIVQLFDHGRTTDTFYFVLEFVDGMNLHQLIQTRKSPIPLEEAIPIMSGTLDGLAYAHHAKVTMEISSGEKSAFTGIVHRDLKPQNILVGRSGTQWVAKISDFGISKSFESAGFTNITKPGDVLGTPMYWPREQITHYRYLNPATDVFSVAAVFYELLTGKWVREGFEALFERCRQNKRIASISDYMNVIVKNPAIPIRRRNPDIPEPVAAVIDRALQEAEVPYDEKEMRKALARLRYADARVFLDEFTKALREVGLLDKSLPPPVSPEPVEPKKAAGSRIKEEAVPSDFLNADWQESLQLPDLAQHDLSAQAGSFFYSIIHQASRKKVALLVLDLRESSEYLREVGDTYFSNIIGTIYKRVKNHDSALELIFLKSTGDGFLAVFNTAPAAFALASSFLATPIHPGIQVRMALHWGPVKSGPAGDVLGVEVHRVFRMESVQMKDQIDSSTPKTSLPISNRIVVSRYALDRLSPAEHAQFSYAGKFLLKGFDDLCELWVYTK